MLLGYVENGRHGLGRGYHTSSGEFSEHRRSECNSRFPRRHGELETNFDQGILFLSFFFSETIWYIWFQTIKWEDGKT